MAGMIILPLFCTAQFDGVKTVLEVAALATDRKAVGDATLMFAAVLVDMAMSLPTTLLTVRHRCRGAQGHNTSSDLPRFRAPAPDPQIFTWLNIILSGPLERCMPNAPPLLARVRAWANPMHYSADVGFEGASRLMFDYLFYLPLYYVIPGLIFCSYVGRVASVGGLPTHPRCPYSFLSEVA
jgi:hypothetical protein